MTSAKHVPAVDRVLEPSTSFMGEVWANIQNSLGAQVYYALGLGIQKGLPYLLIPVLTHLYGNHTYASYVLYYASVQILANLLCLATVNSVITFWYRTEDKRSLTWTYLTFLLVSQLVLGGILARLVFHIYSQSFGGLRAWPLTCLAFCFTLLYNFNGFLTGVCRARSYSRGYFAAQLVSAAALVVGLVAFRGSARVESLVWLFMMFIGTQDLYLFIAMRDLLGKPAFYFDFALMKRVLAYCLPLIVHVEVVLFLYWVDKYLVRLYFSSVTFSQFTISVQYAFAQAFFSQVFALYTFPLICRLVAQNQARELRSVIRSYNVLLVILGALWIGFVLILFWAGAPLGISPAGFVLLGLGFMLWNVASNYTNVLWARLQSASVAGVLIGAAAVLVAILAVGCRVGAIIVCYSAHLGCAATALGALIYLNRVRRNEPLSS